MRKRRTVVATLFAAVITTSLFSGVVLARGDGAVPPDAETISQDDAVLNETENSDEGILQNASFAGSDEGASLEEDQEDGASDEGANYMVSYQAHVQNVGWQDSVSDGLTAGTSGRALRIEALRIKLAPSVSGSVEYQLHVQNIGWQNWVADGELGGTAGKALRVEAIRIKLNGEVAANYDVLYRVHVQNIGWTEWVKNGELAGTTGRALRVEAIEIELVEKPVTAVVGKGHSQSIGWSSSPAYDGEIIGSTGKGKQLEAFNLALEGRTPGSISYSAHVQGIGWQDYVSDGKDAGTTGKSKAIEAVRIKLSGEIAEGYDVWYRAHVANYGWLAWTNNDQVAGTTGLSKKVEAIQVVILPKGSEAPGVEPASAFDVPTFGPATVTYDTFVQNLEWTGAVANGATSGTSGRSLRVESFKANVSSEIEGGISYSAHVQNIGWMPAVSDGDVAGTQGRSLRVEAVRFNLTGDLATYYDVWYRAYIEDYGWLGWARNGAEAGSRGASYRIEAIQICLKAKGAAAPGSTSRPLVTTRKPKVYYHNIEGFAQPNGYYCGPTTGYAVLRNVGAWTSASGTPLSISNVARYMQTDNYGYTSFNDRKFQTGMNNWLGKNVYTTYHTPSYSTLKSAVLHSYETGYATCVDEQERRGGPHFNGHGNSTFSHIMAIDGYNEATDAVYIVDSIGSSRHFWYPSLRAFRDNFLATEIMHDGKQHIGIYTSI